MKHLCVTLLLLCNIAACGKKVEESAPQPNARIGELRGKYQENLEKAKTSWDQATGWPSATDCDGTLWAGLGLAAGNTNVQLGLAKHADGKIHRRPVQPCWESGTDLGSSSTISKDMLLGYVFGLFRAGKKEDLEGLFQYGRDHNWIMGDPTDAVGKVVLTPNGITTLCNAIKKLGGPDRTECHLPTSFGSGSEDYQQHLAVLGILLWGEVAPEKVALTDQIPKGGLETLTDLAYSHANDALFTAAYALYSSGNYEQPIALLLGDYVSPSYVRGSDAYPLVHWLFAANLVLRQFPN